MKQRLELKKCKDVDPLKHHFDGKPVSTPEQVTDALISVSGGRKGGDADLNISPTTRRQSTSSRDRQQDRTTYRMWLGAIPRLSKFKQ